ncbi:unnamed protein product, partial [Darwinula stevensoni]
MDLKAEVETMASSDPDLKIISDSLGKIPNLTAATTHLMETALPSWRVAMGKDPSIEDSVVDTASLIASVQNSLPATEDKDQVGTLLSALSALFQDETLTFSEVMLSISPPLYTKTIAVVLNDTFKPGVHDTTTHRDAIALANKIRDALSNNYKLAAGLEVVVNVSLPFTPGSIVANANVTFITDTTEAARVWEDAALITEATRINGTSVTIM